MEVLYFCHRNPIVKSKRIMRHRLHMFYGRSVFSSMRLMKTNNNFFFCCNNSEKEHNPKVSLKSDIYLTDKSPPTHGLKRHALTIFNRENKNKFFFSVYFDSI